MIPADPSLPTPVTSWREEDWTDLLDDIRDGTVIPVVGSELLTISTTDGSLPLYSYGAERLAEKLRLAAPPKDAAPRSLNQVLCSYLRACKENQRVPEPERVYSRFCEVVEELKPAPPEAFRQLAAITHFNLFVTTTPDFLLEQALNEVRFGGGKGTNSLAFTIKGPRADLRREYERRIYSVQDTPTVFHLFGQLSKSVDQFIISDDDLLEFFFALQTVRSEDLSNLFDALRDNHLLFLGGSFTDWLARFLIRATKRLRLSEKKHYDILAASGLGEESELRTFLEFLTRNTKLYSEGSAAFVSELLLRWEERFPDARIAPEAAALPRIEPPDKMPPGVIFLSYASEDREAVRTLKAHLEQRGLPAWFDRDQLKSGQEWEWEIEQNVRQCGFFIPLISRNTQRRESGYFRREWYYADRLSEEHYHGHEFILPVLLEDEDTLGLPLKVPRSFMKKQAVLCLNGVPADEFCARLEQLVRSRRAAAVAGSR
jgi:hypothetical protein